MITYVYRRRTAQAFSIEKVFDALFRHLQQRSDQLRRLELPHVSSGLGAVLRNIWFIGRQRDHAVLHITGDVHYAALLRPFNKVIITVHDCVVLQRGRGLRRFIFWLLWFRLPMSCARAITVISEQTRDELLRTVSIPRRKIHVIPNFVNPEFRFSAKEFNEQRPRILHIGTTPNKNLPHVIAALRGLSCVLVIVGRLDDSLLGQLRNNGVDHEHHSGLDDDAIAALYREADVISFPSTYEGFGMPIIEGQATGRVVLTSDAEPMRSVAGGGALLVNPHSVADIRRGFLRLIDDVDLRQQLIATGLDNCRRFSIDAVADVYASLYRSLHAG